MSHHVLLLGGHGKIAQLLTPLLLRRGWAVTSVIRTPEQVPAIEKLANIPADGTDTKPGKLNVLVRSLEDIKSEEQARGVLEEVGCDYVVWSAGAGGKGGPERTYAIDRDAAIHFIHASSKPPTTTPRITRFLLISYLASRRNKPTWWSPDEWSAAVHLNTTIFPHYYHSKLAADEALYLAAKNSQNNEFVGIDLRPGTLTLEPAGGVELGRTKGSRGDVSRESVAKVADLLLASEGVRSGWVDMLDGEEEIGEAVRRVLREGVDAAEGEDVF